MDYKQSAEPISSRGIDANRDAATLVCMTHLLKRFTLGLLCSIAILSIAVKAIAAKPAGVEQLLEQAQQAATMNKPEEALKLLDQAVTVAPTNQRALLMRAGLRQHVKDWAGALADQNKLLELAPHRADLKLGRGVSHFMLGHIAECLKDFDAYVAVYPQQSPQLWQRGIALYYAGKFDEGAKQFEEHRTVNPDDVENSAWHFACVARSKGVEAAKKVLIPSAGDARVPMMKVLDLYAGKATIDDVFAAAKDPALKNRTLPTRMFYAHLYVGLYYDATGEPAKAKEQMAIAAEKYVLTDYMHGVAKVHGMVERK